MSGEVMWMMVICRRHKGVLGGWLGSTYFLFMCRRWRCGGRRTRVPRPPHESYDGRGTRVWRPPTCRRKGRMQSCASRNVGMYRLECRDMQDGKRKGVGRKYGSIIAFSFQLAHVSGNTGEDKQHGQQKQGIVVCEPEDIQYNHQQYARIDARQARGVCQAFEKALAGGGKPM